MSSISGVISFRDALLNVPAIVMFLGHIEFEDHNFAIEVETFLCGGAFRMDLLKIDFNGKWPMNT